MQDSREGSEQDCLQDSSIDHFMFKHQQSVQNIAQGSDPAP